ncbi:hypothetical protein BV25DRAFT_1819269 [Artomyces pyxidatus]|uniref:Uncharacterized protein n=1 Tax=Artomyces pyxidatus TaxID=48021 RepID=A0ACB8THB2_9AGAM|nr:hypothetical protein BV25DRAFT_1819269 [Artomyces pyxidatus]
MAVSTFPASSSLSSTVTQAIVYITRPLLLRYPASTIIKLQLALEVNLTAHYSASWVPSEPLRGSGRRCLTFSPISTPPRPIYTSCAAAKVQWSEWMSVLGGMEFDLFVDPGCVSVRFSQLGVQSRIITVWSDESLLAQKERSDELAKEAALQAQIRSQEAARAASAQTLAQQLLREDEDDEEEELFAAIADEMRAPTWMTPVMKQFPSTIPQRSLSPISYHSRSSSRSSNSSSEFTFTSEASDSASSATTISSAATEGSKLSRRERARQARVFIDTTKKEVTNYDGGKTTVLTGGVMLGAPPSRSTRPSAVRPPVVITAPKPVFGRGPASSGSWRSLRA